MAAGEKLAPWEIERRAVGPRDVAIDIKWAGICHSDIHRAREEWGQQIFPMVPGHEIAGVVTAVGSEVSKLKLGDKAGVGVFVDSCRKCTKCREGKEQYCTGGGKIYTYGARFRYEHCPEFTSDQGASAPPSSAQYATFGGYSTYIVCAEEYTLVIPPNLDLASAAPLMCAGITVWSPLMFYGGQANQKIAVAGLGGLGHMAVKLAAAMGAHVTVLSRSESKRHEATAMLGAHAFVNTTDKAQLQAVQGTFDLLLDTIAAEHDVDALLDLVRCDGGNVCMVGLPSEKLKVSAAKFVGPRKMLTGSNIGGIAETQAMLDFCGRHNIGCEVEKIRADQINEAFERTIASDVRYRFVIDTATF
ncbi:hypothetical protein AB1Y20_022153 [Prymnesium parvum]|uniref:Enoyl reductase (ER) domain-containing protein n=1 Tax=Prymnesium parvum TaxID=97485 RepID=A0AB34JHJ2_PRYPA